MRGWLFASVLIGPALAGPAAAQQATKAPDFSAPFDGTVLPLPPPADTGKAVIFTPPLYAVEEAQRPPGCTDPADCRLRIVGGIHKNGAVELNGTLLRW
jgi:hypothetical protein